MPDALMPDPNVIIGEHLRSHARVTALVGTRSSTKLATTMPAIRYTVTSNPKRGPEEWEPSLQVECWGTSEQGAEQLARAVEASLTDLPGARRTGEVAAAEATNAFPSPDPETDRPRVIVLVTLLLFALDPVESL